MKKVVIKTVMEYEGMEWTSRVVDFGISLMVAAAINEVICAFIMVKESDLFRRSVKHNATRAVKEAEAKQRELKESAGDGELFASYSDAVIDKARNDITLLQLAIKQVLDTHKVKHSDILARAECARVLLDMSAKQFANTIRTAECRYLKNFYEHFKEFDMKHLHDAWKMVCTELFVGYNVDLNTPTVKGLFESMLNKFSNGEYIYGCLDQAYEEYPEKRPN